MSTLLPRAIREAGHRFTFLTRDLHHYLRDSRGTHPLLAADNVLTTETNDPATLLPHVERLHGTLRFDGVLTACDYYLETAARIADRLGLPGAAPEAVARAYRKDLTRAALAAAGVPGPAYAVTGDWSTTVEAATRLGYPLVIKPVDLCAGMHVRKVSDESALRHAYQDLTAARVNARQQSRVPLVLIEELLDGPEFSVETVTVSGRTRAVGVTDKSLTGEPWFVENGHMFPADLPPATAAELVDTACAALAAVGLDHGVAHTELRLTRSGPRVVEINPRPAGNRITELVRRVTGVDLPMVSAQLALGETPALAPVRTGVRSAAISFLLPPRAGTLDRVDGTGALTADRRVVEWTVKPSGHRAGPAVSNNEYLGHLMVVDTDGAGARAYAERLVAGLDVRYRDEPTDALPAAPEMVDRSVAAAPETVDRPVAAGPFSSVDDLVAAALAGQLGPDPASCRISVAFLTRQGARHAGRDRAYRNHVLSLRLAAAVGSCAVEPDGLADETAYDCVGRSVAELLAHPQRPVRVAALDAYLMHTRPHPATYPDSLVDTVGVPAGDSLAKSMARAAAVVELLPARPGQTVLVVGVVNSVLHQLRGRGLRYVPCDRAGGCTEWGEPHRPDAHLLMADCDAILATGMTLGDGSFEPLLRHASETGKPLVVYAQSGSALLPWFLGAGLTACSAEPYPFFWLDGGPTGIHRYRTVPRPDSPTLLPRAPQPGDPADQHERVAR